MGGRRLGIAVACAAAIGAVTGVTAPAPAWAEDPDFITGSVGWFDMNRKQNTSTSFNIEYRSDYKLWIFHPMVGAMVNTDAALYGYAGLDVDVFLGRRLVLSGNTAFGAYDKGDSKDLGHWIEFRSGMELAYRFDNRARLGVGFHHISNANIGDKNPGTEILSLIFSYPLGKGN